MSIVTQKYIRKALYVDAVRITVENFDEIIGWCQGTLEVDENATEGPSKRFIRVRVHNPNSLRQTKAYVGDWLLYTERGYKVYTDKAFKASFDLVEIASEPITLVPATPEALAEACLTNEPTLSEQIEAADAAAEYSPRVLSAQEQAEMTTEEVAELIRSGEAVLAEDLTTKE